MYNSYSLELNLEIGIMEELYARGLITEMQMKRAIEILIKQANENGTKGGDRDETSCCIL